MFTGLVETTGQIVALDPLPDQRGLRLVVRAPAVAEESAVGDSIAVNGCCLTVTRRDGDTVAFDAVPETLARTNLGRLTVGAAVNLERPLRLSDRLGGHLVLGHVDAVGEVVTVRPEGNSIRLAIAAPESVRRYLVPKGSIAVDGVSLTVAAVTADGFEVVIIPHTAAVTTLGRVQPGDAVNLEADVVGKYVERLLGPYAGLAAGRNAERS
ncbi:MAG TPA: riboflavin synthase [Limnochordales bacterium]